MKIILALRLIWLQIALRFTLTLGRRFLGSPDRWAEGFAHGKEMVSPQKRWINLSGKRRIFERSSPERNEKCCGSIYGPKIAKGRVQIIGDGETLTVGEYYLQCLMTPGHSSGHLCLYEPQKNLLFSGDHILETITPAIFLWPGEDRNPLSEYLDSLDKVAGLEVDIVLPGHRRAFEDHHGRVSKLKKHHYQREHEIASILDLNGESGKSAYEIASGVSWNIPLPWEQFTTELKWMALAETLAHLKYMEHQKKITSKLLEDEIEYYYLLAE